MSLFNYRTLSVLFDAFLQVCLLRRRPQDLPASSALLSLVVAGYGVLSTALLLPAQTAGVALLTGLIEALMLLLITGLFLYLRSVPERWLQTATALAGAGTVFSLLAFPLFYWRLFFSIGPAAQTLIGLLVMVLVLWNIAVMTYILKHALSSSWMLGVFGSISYIALTSYVLQLVLPAGDSL